jgi:hypothetical protein
MAFPLKQLLHDMNGELMKPANRMNVVFGVLLACFIAMDLKVPDNMAKAVNSSVGQVVLLGIAIFLFMHTHPIIGILFAIAAFELINRSDDLSMYTVSQYIPSENRKKKQMDSYNELPYSSLEEEMVRQVSPLPEHETITTGIGYMPVLSSCGTNASDL